MRSFKKSLYISISAFVLILAIIIAAVPKNTPVNKQTETGTINTVYDDTYDLSDLPVLSAKHCIVTEYETGRILYSKNAFRKSAMASTTKIMTALIVLEKCKLNETTVVSNNAALVEGSEIKLKTGEEISVEHLLYGLMLESGNDAAIALAEHVAKTTENFCDLMNERAKEIGASNTNFTSPHGLDNEQHYTTAYDLSLITKEALKNNMFRQIIGTKTYIAGKRTFTNTNSLLGTTEGVDGGKTGFTNNAGRCIMITAKRNGMRIIAIIFGCPDNVNRTIDGKRLIECIFKNYKLHSLFSNSEKFGTLDITKRKTALANIIITDDIYIPLTEKEFSELSCKAFIGTKVFAIDIHKKENNKIYILTNKNSRKNSVCGKITIFAGEKVIYESQLIQSSDLLSKTFKDFLKETLKSYAFLFKSFPCAN